MNQLATNTPLGDASDLGSALMSAAFELAKDPNLEQAAKSGPWQKS